METLEEVYTEITELLPKKCLKCNRIAKYPLYKPRYYDDWHISNGGKLYCRRHQDMETRKYVRAYLELYHDFPHLIFFKQIERQDIVETELEVLFLSTRA